MIKMFFISMLYKCVSEKILFLSKLTIREFDVWDKRERGKENCGVGFEGFFKNLKQQF